MDTRIPVTIITGFLGSGKTTLLNHLVKNNQGKQLAIIENEFGEVSIDSELVIGVEDGVFELSNGCVCCSMNDELMGTLDKIIKAYPNLQHLIVETTGIADPGPVANSFIANHEVQIAFRLDAIIALADVQFIEQQLIDHEEARKQIAMADLILLNKVDKVELYTKDTAKNTLRRFNSYASVKETSYGVVADVDLLDLKAFGAESVKKTVVSLSATTSATSGKFVRPQGSPAPAKHSDIASHSIVFSEPLDILKFDTWVNLILNFNAKNFYRIKGILHVEDVDQKLIFQAVNNQYVTEGGGAWGAEERMTKLVFIGKYLDRSLLEEGLRYCCANESIDQQTFYNSVVALQQAIFAKNKEGLVREVKL